MDDCIAVNLTSSCNRPRFQPNRKNPMSSLIDRFTRPIVATAVALACVVTIPNIHAAEPGIGDAKNPGTMMEQCTEMQASKARMMADMKVQNADLSERIAQMNSSSDDKKLGLLAALVSRMAEQRIARDAHMEVASATMMKHMMQHMNAGKDSMQGCPMMQGGIMSESKGKAGKAAESEKVQK